MSEALPPCWVSEALPPVGNRSTPWPLLPARYQKHPPPLPLLSVRSTAPPPYQVSGAPPGCTAPVAGG
jgi:hypothetical protein